MALEIKHIADLTGYSFSIPAYQRGYRWERKQVKQLLDDLLEFANFKVRVELESKLKRDASLLDKVGFYCLQPLAVLNKGNDQYEVIDGQQRLTTIYLILSWMEMEGHIQNPIDGGSSVQGLTYHLTFDIRDDKFFLNKEFAKSSALDTNAMDNIDFYFMAKAYSVIKEWFGSLQQVDINHVFNLLFPQDYFISSLSPDEKSKSLDLLNDVRFVWYQVDNADSSIPTFNDLNYGKISLTAAELIKALLMQNSENRDEVHSTNLQRSLEWSIMEQDLQDPFFWAMIHPQDEPCDLHLEYILDIVSEEIYKSKETYYDSKEWNKEDKDWDYLIINDYIINNPTHKSKAEAIEDVWQRIQKVYNVFHNWFLSRTYYHQIGLLMLLIQRKNKNMKQKARVEMLNKIMDLYDSYTKNIRSVFDEDLVNELGTATLPREIKEKDNQGKEYKRRLSINELRYGEHDEDIRRVLLLYCVEECIMETNDAPRFPFHLVEKFQVYSLEHIHPQHLNDADIPFDTLIKWYQDKREILNKRGKIASQAIKNAVSFLDGQLVKSNEETYKKNKQPVLNQLDVIDKEFDQLSNMSEEHLHSLYNMALVGQNVNSALSNNLLDIKRDILKTHEYIAKDSYIPLGTWRAFNKYFSKEVSDLQFWSKEDRIAYFGEIERVYNKYHK